MDDKSENIPSTTCSKGCDNDNVNLKLISVENGANGLGIKLSKSSWDPYPFVSFVDESREQLNGLQIGDCLLKVVFMRCSCVELERGIIKVYFSRLMDVMCWDGGYKT